MANEFFLKFSFCRADQRVHEIRIAHVSLRMQANSLKEKSAKPADLRACFNKALAALPSTRAIPDREVFYLGNPFRRLKA
jgi:hypothetical protein